MSPDAAELTNGALVIAASAPSANDGLLRLVVREQATGSLSVVKVPAQASGTKKISDVRPVALTRSGTGVAVLVGFVSHVGAKDMSIVMLTHELKPNVVRHFRTLDIPTNGTPLGPKQGTIVPRSIRQHAGGLTVLAQTHDLTKSPPVRSTWLIRTDAQLFTQLSAAPFAWESQSKSKPTKTLLGVAVAPFFDGSIGLALNEHSDKAPPSKATLGLAVWARLDAMAATPPACAGCDASCKAPDSCSVFRCVPAASQACIVTKKDDCTLY